MVGDRSCAPHRSRRIADTRRIRRQPPLPDRRTSMFDLSGQVALVTGGAAGIGQSIAAVLAQAGAKVVIAASDAERGAATAKDLGGSFKELDVSDQAGGRPVVEET